MKVSISEYKRRAKEALAGQWGVNAGVFFMIGLTTVIVTSIVTSLSNYPPESPQNEIFNWMISIFILFAFTYGSYYVGLFVIRGGRANIGQIFSVFQSKYYFPLLLINLLETVVQLIIGFILLIPVFLIAGASIYAAITISTQSAYTQIKAFDSMMNGVSIGLVVVAVLFFIVVAIVTYLISAVFRFTVLAKMDFPHLTIIEALRYAWLLLKDRMGQYLLLQLSFIGWYILGTICLVVGVFWVMAYQNVCTSAFYDEARQQKGNPQELSIGR
ncbi:hypothetical protein IGI37_000976 [Enterococcus sp. AZ194]|uniref:DUF975 family protein n=1 Tax=Enterococcus sp. AZ194 TaxID=2774629 RepID=UPI003F2366DD